MLGIPWVARVTTRVDPPGPSWSLGLQAQRLREALAEAEAKIAGVQAGDIHNIYMAHGNRFGRRGNLYVLYVYTYIYTYIYYICIICIDVFFVFLPHTFLICI